MNGMVVPIRIQGGWLGRRVIYEEDGCDETGGAVDGFPGGEAALPLHR